MQYGLDNITILPARRSDVDHRGEINLEYLPIITSPMSSVIDDKNCFKFRDSGIVTIIPRSVSFKQRIELSKQKFIIAVSLDEFNQLTHKKDNHKIFTTGVLIDVANGHMKQLFDAVKSVLKIYPDSKITVGNIGNPETFKDWCQLGVTGVRLGIGGGSVCLSSSDLGVHTGIVNLIKDCYKIKQDNNYNTLIIADGGFNGYGRINKALALGADYVMLGKLLAQSEEACGKVVATKYREYYGMSTIKAQKEVGSKLRASEGISIKVPILYSLNTFVTNFTSALKSCMSYTNSYNLTQFIGQVKTDIISPAEFNSYYKSNEI